VGGGTESRGWLAVRSMWVVLLFDDAVDIVAILRKYWSSIIR
jgi:hypothetical protein